MYVLSVVLCINDSSFTPSQVAVHIDIRKAQEDLEKARALDEERSRPMLLQLVERNRLDADLIKVCFYLFPMIARKTKLFS